MDDPTIPKPNACCNEFAQQLLHSSQELAGARREIEQLLEQLSEERRRGLRASQEFDAERQLLLAEADELREHFARLAGSEPPPRHSLIVRRDEPADREAADTVRPPPAAKRGA